MSRSTVKTPPHNADVLALLDIARLSVAKSLRLEKSDIEVEVEVNAQFARGVRDVKYIGDGDVWAHKGGG